MNTGGLAIYIRKKRLYIIRVKNANYDTKMVYFDDRHPALRIKKEGSNYILVKENMPFEFPLGKKMEDLLLFDETKNLTNPYEVIKNKLVVHFLDLTGHRYDLYDEAAILRERVRKILSEDITHGIFDKDELMNIAYNRNYTDLKPDAKAIKYFIPNMDFREGTEKIFPFVLNDEEIAGLAKLEKSPYHKDSWWISFISVQEKYQGNGFSKILVDEIFKFAKSKKIKIIGSSRTEIGQQRLSKAIENSAEKYGVEYIPS